MKARIRHITVAASAAALLGVSPARAINVTYKAVLVNGQAAPGLPGETLRVVSNPGLIPVAPVIDSEGPFIALALAPAADFDQAGGVTLQDLFDYLAAYFGGCS